MQKRVAFSCLVAVAIVMAPAGCSRSSESGLSRATLVGTWYEDPTLLTARQGPAGRPVAGADARQLTFSSDGTFELVVCDSGGSPVSPAQSAVGRWHISGENVVFTIKTVTLDAAHARWVPERYLGLQLQQRGATCDCLDVRGLDGVRVRYGRTPPTAAAPTAPTVPAR